MLISIQHILKHVTGKKAILVCFRLLSIKRFFEDKDIWTLPTLNVISHIVDLEKFFLDNPLLKDDNIEP